MKKKNIFRKTLFYCQWLKNNHLIVTLFLGILCPKGSLQAQRFDYADLLGKTLFFIEANACGPKPPTSTVPWRSNCHMDDGGGSLIGGFHDAGDHVKFNYPMALPIYTWALSYLDYKEQYQATGNEQRILGILRHAGEYMIRCHTAPNEYVIQVGLGRTDHQFWQSPEENTYFRDVLKIDTNKKGSDLAGPTAGAMAAISDVFKDIDPGFSNNLLTHARQLFNFADTNRGPFSNHIPANERPFYQSQNGALNQIDDLMIGAVLLYRRTGEQTFKNKADQFFEQTKFLAQGYAPSFGDHQYVAHMIMSQITGDPKYINASVRTHINNVLNQHFTPGGLWIWRAGHNEFNTYQTVGNAYLAYALAEFVGPGDGKYQQYKDFAIRQVEYLSGRNPRNSSYIGGFGPNFPRRIHHRAANNDTTLRAGAPDDQFVLNGALVSGPDANDNYTNDRTNHRQTEPTLSPNSLLTILAAQMVKEYDLGGNPIPPNPTNNDIISVNAPDEVSPGQTATVSVNYVSNGTHDIRVAFQSVSAPNYTVYGETTVGVTEGTRTVNIDIPIDTNTPISQNEYQFQAFITTRGGGFDDRFDNLAKTGVDCVAGSGNPNPTNSNIVQNNSFTDNADNWELWTSANATATLDTNTDNGNVAIANAGSNAFEIQLRQKVSLRRGHYVMHFRGQSDANRDINFRVIKASPDYNAYFNRTIPLTPTNRFIGRYLWYSQETTDDRFLQFNVGGNATNVRIDDVAMVKYNNQLTNSHFNTNLSSWSTFVDSDNASGISLTREDNKGRVTIGNGGSAGYHVQLYNRTSLQQGVTYALSFEVSAPQDRPITAKLQLHASPYTALVERTVTATSTPRYHLIWFTADKDYPDVRVQFNLGNNNGDVIFDNVELLKPEHINSTRSRSNNIIDDIKGIPEAFDLTVYPNPNNSGILFINSDITITDIKIFDIAGKEIVNYKSFDNNGQEQVDVSKLSSGSYLLKTRNIEGVISQKKIIIQN